MLCASIWYLNMPNGLREKTKNFHASREPSGVGKMLSCGAGTAIPSVRLFCERQMARKATLLRINVREAQVPPGGIPLAMGALEALRRIDAAAGAPPS